MDSKEGMDMAKMAVQILLVLVVISAVVALLYLAYSWFNSGSAKLGDQVNSIDSSAYSMYDDAQVTGTDVLTALKTYRDADLCIVIANGKNSSNYASSIGKEGGPGAISGLNYCAKIANEEGGDEWVAGTADKVVELTYNNDRYEVPDLVWNPNTGITDRNTNFSPTTQKSNANAYVKTGAQFYSKLIYSTATGEMCGIAFTIMDGGTSTQSE